MIKRLFRKVRPTIGIDIGTNYTKAIELRGKSAKPHLVSFQRIDTPSELDSDGQISNLAGLVERLADTVQKNGWEGREVVTAVGGRNIIIRHLKFPPMAKAELEQVINFEKERYIPFNNQEVVVDYLDLGPLKDEQGQHLVLLAALLKETALTYHNIFETAGLDLVAIDLIPLALQRSLDLYEQPGVTAVADIGAVTTTFFVIKDKMVNFTRTTATAGNGFNKILTGSPIGEITADGELVVRKENIAESLDSSKPEQNMQESLREQVREITRSFDFWRTQSQGKNVSKLLLTGGIANLKGITGFLSQELGLKVEIGQPLPGLANRDLQFGPEFALAAGLALRGVVA